MEQELAAIKKMVGQVLQCSRHTALHLSPQSPAAAVGAIPGNSMPDALFQDYVKLLQSEVAAEIADEIVAQVPDELTPGELADETIVHQTVLRHLASIIPADAEVPRAADPRDQRPLTIALIGPTGVGKTTTVAKLAAAYKLRHGKKVGLVTSDTYRIAAVDQLRTYAEIIGLPLKVAMSPLEMASVCQSLGDCDVVLIDTAGRSQKDAGRLEELRAFIAAAKPHQTHLVLSSTASESVLVEAAQRFATVSPDRIIFTKLDEAVNFGVLLTVARKVSLKLSYVTTGQEVPDHIEVGQPERLARLLLDGGKLR
jgi:flagellar biosynthesis protein FlhF